MHACNIKHEPITTGESQAGCLIFRSSTITTGSLNIIFQIWPVGDEGVAKEEGQLRKAAGVLLRAGPEAGDERPGGQGDEEADAEQAEYGDKAGEVPANNDRHKGESRQCGKRNRF